MGVMEKRAGTAALDGTGHGYDDGTLPQIWRNVLKQVAPLYVAAADGRLLFANDGYWEMVTLADSESYARAGGWLPECHREAFAEALRLNETVVRRESIQRNGEARHFGARHFPISDRKGAAVAVAGIFDEITLEAEAGDIINRERQRFADVLRATSDWIWEIDAEARFTFVSDRIIDAIDLPPVKIRGRNILSLGQFVTDTNGFNVGLEALARRRPFRDAAYEVTLADGTVRTFHLSGVPNFDDRGAYRGFRGAGHDVTARLAAEAEARRSRQALEETLQELTNKNSQLELIARRATAAKQAKEEFLAGMSHELRTPLNAIIGFADLVKMQPFGEVAPRYLEYMTEISKAGQHLLGLINDCLDLSRLEMDNLPISRAPYPLADILHDARAMIELRAEAREIDIEKLSYDGDDMVEVDPTRCFQIFVNILGNGVKFTPEGGALGLETRHDPTGRFIDITVWDTGPGIAPDALEMIFEKFQQSYENIMCRKNDGVGLGLTLSRQFARLMGGDISLESKVGEGSRFTVRLPLANRDNS